MDIEYISFSNRLDIQIQHTPSAIRFQQWASVISLVLALCWLVAHIVFFYRDVINESVEDRLDNFYDVPDTGHLIKIRNYIKSTSIEDRI